MSMYIEGIESLLPLPVMQELDDEFLDDDEVYSALLSLLCDREGLGAFLGILHEALAPVALALTPDSAP